MKKIIFFWSIFHLFGYMTFVVGLNPSIKGNEYSSNGYEHFLFTPKYGCENCADGLKLNPDCYNCETGERQNFWPFHKFTYGVREGSWVTGGFVGVWGYYGHYEFLFYMVLPFLVILLVWLYRRFIKE